MRPRLLRGMAITAALTGLVLAAYAHPGHAQPAAGKLLHALPGQAVKDSYLVALKDDRVTPWATGSVAERLTARVGGRVGHVYRHAMRGFEVTVDEAGARQLAADPAVAYVEQNAIMRPADTQPRPPAWGIDRIDERVRVRDWSYTYPSTAWDVTVYVVDSGIQATHFDFGFRVAQGHWTAGTGPANVDCLGHGTHVAGTIGGFDHGVAKGVTLVPVRVFECEDTTTTERVAWGIEWIHGVHPLGQRGIVNISLTGGPSAYLDDAVNRAMIFKGLLFSVSAGNQMQDACSFSPSRIPGVITVGGVNDADIYDGFSNGGACVDVHAPSTSIRSAWHTFDVATEFLSGTSMSAAHASGVAAIMWSLHPTLVASQVHTLVRQTATPNPPPNQYQRPPTPLLFLPQVVSTPLPVWSGVTTNFLVNRQLAAAGGVGPYRWSAAGLPCCLALNPSTGLLSGTFREAGAFTVTVTVTDATGQAGYLIQNWSARREVCPTC